MCVCAGGRGGGTSSQHCIVHHIFIHVHKHVCKYSINIVPFLFYCVFFYFLFTALVQLYIGGVPLRSC